MRLTTRVVLSLLLIGALGLLAGALGWLGAQQRLEPALVDAPRLARSAQGLTDALHEAALVQARAIASRDPEAVALYRNVRRRAAAWLNEYRSLLPRVDERREDEPGALAELALSGLDRVASDLEAGRFDEAQRTFAAVAEPRLRSASAALDRQVESSLGGLAAALAGEAAWGRLFGLASAALGATAMVVALGIAAVLARELAGALRALSWRTQLLADGDLASPTPQSGLPELGALGRTLSAAIESARVAILQVRDALGVMATSSGQFVQSARQYAAGSEQQAAAVVEISETMERLSAAAAQIAAGARQATEAAADGRLAVAETADGVGAIRGVVDAAAERSAALRLGSERVGEVADLISAIAERTHILALNAAIEASTAGEYGRRFAVVAGQVRELAADTRRATEQVKATVAELRDALAALDAGGEEAKDVALRVDQLARRAVASMDDVVAVVETIARATVSQHGASAQLVQTMRDMVEVSRESAASSRAAAEGAARLNTTAAELESIVTRFRLAPRQ